MFFSKLVMAALAATVLAEKTPVTPLLLANFERYAAFASAAYSSDCANPPFNSTVVRYINDVPTDTQATLFRDDIAQQFIISFRGTSDIQDFVTDLDQVLVPCVAQGIQCPTCLCWQGYLIQYNAVANTVKSAIDAGLLQYPGYSLVVTGHSMGGALASLAAASLDGQGLPLIASTYGQPRTGNQAYANLIDSAFNGTMYRLTHTNDGVPQIPAQSDGYRHHSREYWQSDDPPTIENTFQCQGQEPSDCNQSEPGYGIGNGGIGINAAHLSYFGISTGNPLDPNAAC
ncbi:hypothetical protein JX266_011393 [Neoarthrinium moseri]|nr:hypothetical protein JX266_011393 [Neoarthrinium moseri]